MINFLKKLFGGSGKKQDFPGAVGRNDICPCGSGKKYKKCCMIKMEKQRKPRTPNPTPGGY